METDGVSYLNSGRCCFKVWAPLKERMVLHLVHPVEKRMEMEKDEWGYFTLTAEDIHPGARYFFRPDDKKDYPDPASRFQPQGVHGPSEVVDHAAYQWQDGCWKGLPFQELIFYEMHTGTFTQEGTFEAIIPFLKDLAETGINAIELMPVAQFPGNRNWGYDGTYPYAVQNSYGGPEGLKRLIDSCHRNGIAVFLDVVYNHLGPEGNYFDQFGPYFTDKYGTPWGKALNVDGEWSDGVRAYFSDNPLYWFQHYHIDGLRCDAIEAVVDVNAINFWELILKKVKAFQQKAGRNLYMIAESDLNSPRVIKGPQAGGYGFTAQWLGDFHHALYVLLDKEGTSRYVDFGRIQQLAKAYTEGFVHTGEFVSFRKRRYGASSAGIAGDRFVVFNQNHDQVGNRALADRLSVLVDFERLKLAAAALLLSPYIPMLFMGEEYGEENPFFYFVSHSDKELIQAVKEGRRKEFENYKWEARPPDPQDSATFERSKLQWRKRSQGRHQVLLQWYRKLISLRKTTPALQSFNKSTVRVDLCGNEGFVLQRQSEDYQQQLICIFNLSELPFLYTFSYLADRWVKRLDSREAEWLEKAEETGEAGETSPLRVLPNEKIAIAPLSVLIYSS